MLVCVCTWSITQDSEVGFFLRQYAEHHVPGRFPGAVQNPGRERSDRAQRADVDDDARQTDAPRDRSQHSGGQTERGAHVQRQIRVHLVHIREITTITRHVTERSCAHTQTRALNHFNDVTHSCDLQTCIIEQHQMIDIDATRLCDRAQNALHVFFTR